MSDQLWHYQDTAGQQHGPITAGQLQQMVASGQINTQTNVWTEGLEEWVPVSQVEGLVPTVPPAVPPPITQQAAPPEIPQQPQINLGPATAGTPLTPYAAPKKSPVKLILFGIVALVVLGIGIKIAMAPSEEEKRRDIPGYAGFSDANSMVSSLGGGKISGNTDEAKTISKAVSKTLKEYRDASIEKGKSDSGVFPVFCMRKKDGEQNIALLIIKVPKIRKFTDEAKKIICEGAWAVSKIALQEIGLDPEKTKLVVAIRGVAIYDTIYIGKPSLTKDPNTDPLEGVEETHSDSKVLHQFFIKE